jgi:formyl-CoA transferase
MAGVLDGIRIVDFTIQEQGPASTLMLGDFGAEIIKIERPGRGDPMRGGEDGFNGVPHYGTGFIAFNRNKKSVAVNLKAPEGKQIIYDLAKVSDVFVSNFRPGVMERLGFGYDDLVKINPRIIVAYGSGYGQTGPYKDRIGQDMAGQAMGGMTAQSAHFGNPPVIAGYDTADYFGAMLLSHGILLALFARERTGRGQVVDSNLLNTGVVGPTKQAVGYLNTGEYRKMKEEVPTPPNPLYSIYETKDEKFVMAIGIFTPDPYPKMCTALEIDASFDGDKWQWFEHFQSGMRKFTRDEVEKRFVDQDLVAAPVNEFPEVFSDPQVLHNEMVIEAEHPVAGKVKMVGFPVKLSDTPATCRTPPPLLGEQNEEVLKDILGMSDEQITELYEKDVIEKYKTQ